MKKILRNILLCLSCAVTTLGFAEVQPLPDSERAQSEAGEYLYLFSTPAPNAASYSFFKVVLDVDGAVQEWKDSDLLKIVHKVDGHVNAFSRNKEVNPMEGFASFPNAHLTCRLPLPKKLEDITSLKLSIKFWRTPTVVGSYQLGTTEDPTKAVQIYSDLKAGGEIKGVEFHTVDLDQSKIQALKAGTLEAQVGGGRKATASD